MKPIYVVEYKDKKGKWVSLYPTSKRIALDDMQRFKGSYEKLRVTPYKPVREDN